MAKKLLVKTPVTVDGKNLLYNKDKQPQYATSILELAARKGLESLNSRLPEILRHEIEEIEVLDEVSISSSTEDLKKKLLELEAESENHKLRQRIAELEAEKAQRDASKDEPSLDVAQRTTVKDAVRADIKGMKAEDAIATIAALNNPEEIKAVIEGEQRKTVLEAAEKRLAELGANK